MSRVFDEQDADDDAPTGGAPGPSGHLRPIGWRLVALLLVVGALLGWGTVLLLRLLDEPMPVTPWTMSALMLLLAVAAWWWSRRLRAAMRRPQTRPAPETGVAAFTIARSLFATGMLVAGGHLSWVAAQLGSLEIPLFRERALWGAVAVAAGLALGWAGWRLEGACRVGGDSTPP